MYIHTYIHTLSRILHTYVATYTFMYTTLSTLRLKNMTLYIVQVLDTWALEVKKNLKISQNTMKVSQIYYR